MAHYFEGCLQKWQTVKAIYLRHDKQASFRIVFTLTYKKQV